MSAQFLGNEILKVQRGTAKVQRLFAIADAAQSSALPDALNTLGVSECLFNVRAQSDLARNAPHLVELPPFDNDHKAWRWILQHGSQQPYVTVVGTTLGFDALLQSLRALAEIRLPDGDEMFFAFWDPAILGSLVGQQDDATLHIAGPILSTAQRTSLLHGLIGWWYWDRAGAMHSIQMPASPGAQAGVPFELSQGQVDDLVEASVPDHIRYYVELNQPQLFEGMSELQRYSFVRTRLAAARALGLAGMGDLVNYTCASLIYRDRMAVDPVIVALLERVSRGEIDFDAALKGFP